MKELWMMSGKEALRFSKEKSGLTNADIARQLGVSHSIVTRYFNKDDTYLPSLEMIPRLCTIFGNDFLLHWIEARLKKREDDQRQEILCALTKIETAYHKLRFLVEKEKISLTDLELQEAVDRLMLACDRLPEIVPGNIATMKRNKNGPPCPCWKRWKNHQ